MLRPSIEEIERFVDSLAVPAPPEAFNPWRSTCPIMDDPTVQPSAPNLRRARLVGHLDCIPMLILVGEAPGYQGCRYSGVPFTSERLIVEGQIPRVGPAARITTRQKPWSEPSATIVWKALHELGIAETTVLWNAFPWHPHQFRFDLTNRRPTEPELELGAPYLKALVAMYPGAYVVPVGRVAEHALQKFGVAPDRTFSLVRHPANGGAPKFREQLTRIVRVARHMGLPDQVQYVH